MDDIREQDQELANIREFIELWFAYELELGTDYTTAEIVEIACRPPAPNDYNPQPFKQLLLRVAATRGAQDAVSADRLGWWLRRVSGRVVGRVDANGETHRYRLIKGQTLRSRARFQLVEV